MNNLFDIYKLKNETILLNEEQTPIEYVKMMKLTDDVKDNYKWFGKINSIDDLINVYNSVKNNKNDNIVSNINIYKLKNIIPGLIELQSMIGLTDIKKSLFKHIIFQLQDLDNENKDLNHTVIKGPPGVGKTKLAGIIANIYRGLGVLSEGKVVTIHREDLIAGYLGQTGEKTKKKLEEAIGNVLLFDEAYSLGGGSSEKQDTYAQQAIDQINWFLSERGNEFICIIAGYKEELEKRFFAMNPGLARRFPIHYNIIGYTAAEMFQILKSIILENDWKINENIDDDYFISFIEENKENFPHFGGDLNNFFANIKKNHCSRLLEINNFDNLRKERKNINIDDIKNGFDLYKENNGYNTKDDKSKFIGMYS